MKWFALIAVSILLVPGCRETTPPEPAATPTPAVATASPAATEAPVADTTPSASAPQEAGFIVANIQVVDLAGKPLMGMAPIVTRQPNAFDKPVAMGDPTDAKGLGTLRFENKEHLFLRAWDPTLGYFPNNFYEVLPGGSNVEGTLTIQMVGASGLEAQLLLPDGSPAANMTVGLMLSHATRGPWWPAQATASAEGLVRFPNLPAGEFILAFKIPSGPGLEVGETPLPPGSPVNLGVLTLQ